MAVLLLASSDHATQLVLASELAAELAIGSNKLLADLDQRLLGGDGAVGLDTNEQLRNIRVRD